ncbi:unnamed protein product [Sphenostylis stenocarpa]|uniref:Uncharacterized protein n=1 Tax=Sphenostylis stenocarpa TaxID=92480 RepID=A0AA86VWW4_9FABA|nr:unnamed protein product [Sphenostylis stenocarpa]
MAQPAMSEHCDGVVNERHARMVEFIELHRARSIQVRSGDLRVKHNTADDCVSKNVKAFE